MSSVHVSTTINGDPVEFACPADEPLLRQNENASQAGEAYLGTVIRVPYRGGVKHTRG